MCGMHGMSEISWNFLELFNQNSLLFIQLFEQADCFDSVDDELYVNISNPFIKYFDIRKFFEQVKSEYDLFERCENLILKYKHNNHLLFTLIVGLCSG